MLCCCRADEEDLNSQNEAELRRQVGEPQQETEHVYELLDNNIQLLQEVRGAHRSTKTRASGPLKSLLGHSLYSGLSALRCFSSLSDACVLELLTRVGFTTAQITRLFQESRFAKDEASQMETLAGAEKGCNLELSERGKDATKNREDAPGDQVKLDQDSAALAQRDR